MLKKFLTNLIAEKSQDFFDPVSVGNPVALKAEWTPLRHGGSNFATHKLKQVSPQRIEFRPAAGAFLFYSVFILFGIFFSVGFVLIKLQNNDLALDANLFIPIAAGLFFTVIGGILLYYGTRPIVFDKELGYFWKGRKTIQQIRNNISLKNVCALKDIHALQIISEYCRTKDSSYYSYELNLILESGNRLNVVDHGNRKKLYDDTKKVSEFLEKPIWGSN